MTVLVLLLLGGLILALSAVLIQRFLQLRRDGLRSAQEEAMVKAARDYLARYKVRGRVIAMRLPDGHMVLLIETPPQKKLRFSYIIEQPIKNYIRVHTGVELHRIFWRFPIPPAVTKVPDVCYVDPATMTPVAQVADEAPPRVAPVAAKKTSAASNAVDDDDDYFQHDSYRIEEVSWEDFSTISNGQSPDADAHEDKKP